MNTIILDANQLSCLMTLQRESERWSITLFSFGIAFFLLTLWQFNVLALGIGVVLMSLGAYYSYKCNEAMRQLRIHRFSGMVKAESVYKLISLR